MSEFTAIGALVERKRKRLWKESPALGLQSLWEKAAGGDIAANTRVQSFRDGVLTVRCASSGWACELKLAADDMVRRINALRPPGEVKEIRFVRGSL